MKIKATILLFVILVGCKYSHAQISEKDSLLQLLRSPAHDSVRSDALNELAFFMFDYNVDSSIVLANQALQLARHTNNLRQQARALKNIGISYDIKGNTDSAVFFLNRALAIALENNFHPSQANILTDIANAYYAAGNYELAIRNHFAALKLREGYGEKKFIAQSYNNIALVYRARKDYANALRYNQLSLQIKQVLNNQQGIVNSYINIGACYQYMKQYDSAMLYAQLVTKHAFVPQDIHEGQINYASALQGLGRYAAAKKIMLEVLPGLNKAEEQASFISCHQGLGMIALAQAQPDTALYWVNTGLAYAMRYNDREAVATFYKLAAGCFEAKKDYPNAYLYSNYYHGLQDSLLNEENLRQINEMNAVYDKEKQQQQIGNLTTQVETTQATAQQNERQRNMYIIASLVLLVLAGAVLVAYANNRKKNLLLAKQKALIEVALKEKEVLMKEIHHRVKNNLQVVTSLLNLQSHYISDEKAYSAVQAGRNRVQSMSLIHQFLYREASNLTSIKIKDYITELMSHLDDTYTKEGQTIDVLLNVDDVELDIDTVVPVGLIINELVTNAYKYAFVGRAQGTIRVTFVHHGSNGGFLLRVADNGSGMTQTTTGKNGHSFGYRMINAFTEKLQGHLTTDVQEGTTVSITIPYEPNSAT